MHIAEQNMNRRFYVQVISVMFGGHFIQKYHTKYRFFLH